MNRAVKDGQAHVLELRGNTRIYAPGSGPALGRDPVLKLIKEELKAQPLIYNRLKGADANQDGFLTLEEIRNFMQPMKPGSADVSKPAPVREGPRVVSPSAAGMGQRVPDMEIKTVDDKVLRLKDIMGKNGLVIAFTNTTCPICKKYAPSLAELENKLKGQDVGMLLINPTMNETQEAIRRQISQHGFQSPYVHDANYTISKTLKASSTAEVFLLDARQTLVYRGALDDQYGLGYSHNELRQHYLANAVAAMVAQREFEPQATTAPGCELDLSQTQAVTLPAVTYHNRISRILQTNCVECHREGGVAPFTLDKWEDVIAHAGMIRKVVQRGTMPPWFAVTSGEKHIPFSNDRSLNAADKEDLLAWLNSDRPVGDPNDAPLPRPAEKDWQIGKPDAVFTFPRAVPVKATGVMPYIHINVDTHLTEDKWVQALEVKPSAREVVHHVLVFVLPPGTDDVQGMDETTTFFGIYVPGQSVLSYPEGFAKFLPKGSKLRFQMHYTPNGQATIDQTSIGMVYADKPPQQEVKVAGIVNTWFRIPPEADNHPVYAQLKVPFHATILGFLPHMHLRGKAFLYEIQPPGQSAYKVLDIPRYDFNWQLYYRLAEPIAVTPGTLIKGTGWFDNSKGNPANPDSSREVRWGPQTYDEMMLGYVEYYV
ncbi:MAG TPA: redoxin domain-containing protein, partial [Gemmatales bacterium]|nr:redoxin domain-containing protein [Gemmatales bacterium]